MTGEMQIDQVSKGMGTGGWGICLFIQNAFRAGRNPNAKEQEYQEVTESLSQPHLHHLAGQPAEHLMVFGNGI